MPQSLSQSKLSPSIAAFHLANTDITLYKVDIANMLHNIYLISRHRASLIFICQCVVLAVYWNLFPWMTNTLELKYSQMEVFCL